MYNVPTDGIVERLSGLLVPDQGGLSLIGHAHRLQNNNNNNNRNVNKTTHSSLLGVVNTTPPTFYVGGVDVELVEFLTGPLHTLIHRLHDLFGVLLHPSDSNTETDMETH